MSRMKNRRLGRVVWFEKCKIFFSNRSEFLKSRS